MRIVLITGAGRGLGRAIAEIYHQNGFEVIATDTDFTLLSDLVGKESFTVLKLDVASEKDIKLVAKNVLEKFGRLDVLISNAGVFDFYSLSEAGAEKLKSIFDVNVFGLANLTKHFLPLLLKSNGRLIVISSESYKVPSPFQPYSVSKQMLEKLYEGIRLELLTKNIKSILIRPGAINTNILNETLNFVTPTDHSAFAKEFENFLKNTKKYIGKISTPQAVAKVVLKAGIAMNPKNVYHINHNLLTTIISVLPKRLKDRLIIKSLK